MGRVRVFVVLVLALSAGGVFAVGTYNYVQKLPKTAVASMPTRPVVVAATDLDVGAELTPDDVRVIAWPQNSVPKEAIADPKEVMGRGVVMPIIENEPILTVKLASKEAGAGLPPAIPPGLRAVSVRVNEVIGVAGYVLPGTRVDVLATVNPTSRPEDVQSKVILTNVQVLAAGTKIERDGAEGKPIAVSVVTLMVDPAQAERLTLASTEGKIQLALRNPVDKTAPATGGIRPASLMAGGTAPIVRQAARSTSAPAAAPAPHVQSVPATATVEIIRGDKRAQEVVSQE